MIRNKVHALQMSLLSKEAIDRQTRAGGLHTTPRFIKAENVHSLHVSGVQRKVTRLFIESCTLEVRYLEQSCQGVTLIAIHCSKHLFHVANHQSLFSMTWPIKDQQLLVRKNMQQAVGAVRSKRRWDSKKASLWRSPTRVIFKRETGLDELHWDVC